MCRASDPVPNETIDTMPGRRRGLTMGDGRSSHRCSGRCVQLWRRRHPQLPLRFFRSHVVSSCSVRIPFLLPYNEADLSGDIDLAQHPFPTSSILGGCLGPSFAAWPCVSSDPCSTHQDTHGALLNSPTIPHDRVEGTLNPSFSHSHPHSNPCHPNHIK